MPFVTYNGPFGPVIVRTVDGAWIPTAPANRDYQDYQAWIVAGSPATWPARSFG
jgi:hypothetical protein